MSEVEVAFWRSNCFFFSYTNPGSLKIFLITLIGWEKATSQNLLLACLHDQNKSGFFGVLVFNQPIRESE